jgi:ferredoxin-NADP reductase
MWHRATIQSRKQLSPTVTGLTLKIHESSPSTSSSTTTSTFHFVPGQWVDFQPLPTSSWKTNDNNRNKTIGGYSITSIPQSLPYIDLAIQSSRHPVAEWVTYHAKVNDWVNLRVGGSFTYATGKTTSDSCATMKQGRLLFVAGGVGINPLFSMIQQWSVDLRQQHERNRHSRAVLLYSGRHKEDLLFVKELDEMVRELSDHFRVVLTTTTAPATTEYTGGIVDDPPENDSSVDNEKDSIRSNILFKKGRIDHDMIKDAVQWINMGNEVHDDDERQVEEEEDDDMIADLVYICGPPGMPEDVQHLLLPSQKGRIRFVRSTEDVHFEKWW